MVAQADYWLVWLVDRVAHILDSPAEAGLSGRRGAGRIHLAEQTKAENNKVQYS